MRRVVRLSVTPVKSTALQHPEEVTLERFGVAENRRFYLAEEDGELLSSRWYEWTIPIRSAYDPGREWLSLAFPDGTVAEGDVTDLGRAIETDFWGRLAAGHVVEGPWNDALTAHLGHPIFLVVPDHPGDANDSAPLSMFSSASADELGRRSGKEDVDARRFRMLVEVDGCQPHEEDQWVGGDVRIGRAVVRVERPVARCRITTLHPDTGKKDFDSLKAIVSYRGVDQEDGINFGVYASVAEPGRIRVGDAVEPLAREPTTPAQEEAR
jgi:uncharacterized protein YcbX